MGASLNRIHEGHAPGNRLTDDIQRLQISQGMIRDQSFLGEMPGRALDRDTQQIIQEQDAYLMVDEENIEILSRG